MGQLENRLAELKKHLIPESKPKQEEITATPSIEFTQALRDKVQELKANPLLGDDAYEIRKKQALKEREEKDNAPKLKTVRRRGIFGETI